MNTLIYDGNNLAYRCNSVMELSTKDGRRTSTIFGVLNSIPKDVLKLEHDHGIKIHEVIVAWDYGKNKRRLSLYPEYKGNRKHNATEEDRTWYEQFLEQINILHEFLENLGVKSIKVKGQEADDLIYGLSTKLFQERIDEEVVVVASTDEDFLQLIGESVYIYHPKREELYTLDNFEEVYGIPHRFFLDCKILKGDSSDNISGIPGIGDKTAQKLVLQYEGIPGILANPIELKKSKVTSRLFTREGLETLDRNNQLINLSEFVDTSEFVDEVLKIIEEQPAVSDDDVMKFLKSYQLSSLIVKYKEWIKLFKTVNNRYYD